MNRRDVMRSFGIGAAAGLSGVLKENSISAQAYSNATQGLPAVKITNVKAIATCPHGLELIVVKVETSEPGLYGVGCATFRQRAHAVISAVDDYLNDFCRGKNVDNIEDMW